VEVFVETCEGETGFLDVRVGDPSIEATATRQQFEWQADGFWAGLQQTADGHGRNCRHQTVE
jgi:hypothetical protein